MQDKAATAASAETLRGFAIFLVALALLATLDALAKVFVQRHPAPFVNVVRYTVVLLMAIMLVASKRTSLRVGAPQRKLLAWRGIMLGMVGNTFMPALKVMPLAEATAIYFISPLVIVALSPWLLREHVKARQWIAVGAGFSGMLLIVRPGSDFSAEGCLLMLIAAMSFAMVQILTRKLANAVDMEQQFFYTAVICLGMSAVPGIFYIPQHLPPLGDMLGLIMIGMFSALGQYLLIQAFQRAPASLLAPFNYFHLMLAVIFSIAFFGQRPDAWSLSGMLIIACAGLSLAIPVFRGYVRQAGSIGKRRETSNAAPGTHMAVDAQQD